MEISLGDQYTNQWTHNPEHYDAGLIIDALSAIQNLLLTSLIVFEIVHLVTALKARFD